MHHWFWVPLSPMFSRFKKSQWKRWTRQRWYLRMAPGQDQALISEKYIEWKILFVISRLFILVYWRTTALDSSDPITLLLSGAQFSFFRSLAKLDSFKRLHLSMLCINNSKYKFALVCLLWYNFYFIFCHIISFFNKLKHSLLRKLSCWANRHFFFKFNITF
jgi:hypothetical protein